MSDQELELEQKQRTPDGGEIEDEGLVQRIKTPDLKEIISELEAATASKYAQYYDTVVWICDQGRNRCYCLRMTGDHQGVGYTSNPYSLGDLLDADEDPFAGKRILSRNLQKIKKEIDAGNLAILKQCSTIDSEGKAEGRVGRKTVKRNKF